MAELSVAAQSPSWQLVASAVPQRSVLGPILLSVFINNLDDGREWTSIKFVENTRLVGGVNIFTGRVAIQGKWTGWRNEVTEAP